MPAVNKKPLEMPVQMQLLRLGLLLETIDWCKKINVLTLLIVSLLINVIVLLITTCCFSFPISTMTLCFSVVGNTEQNAYLLLLSSCESVGPGLRWSFLTSLCQS